MITFLLALALLMMSLIAGYYMEKSGRDIVYIYGLFVMLSVIGSGWYILYILLEALALYFGGGK